MTGGPSLRRANAMPGRVDELAAVLDVYPVLNHELTYNRCALGFGVAMRRRLAAVSTRAEKTVPL
jgi:hypothetical protein